MADKAKARVEQQLDEVLDTLLMRGHELARLLLSRRGPGVATGGGERRLSRCGRQLDESAVRCRACGFLLV